MILGLVWALNVPCVITEGYFDADKQIHWLSGALQQNSAFCVSQIATVSRRPLGVLTVITRRDTGRADNGQIMSLSAKLDCTKLGCYTFTAGIDNTRLTRGRSKAATSPWRRDGDVPQGEASPGSVKMKFEVFCYQKIKRKKEHWKQCCTIYCKIISVLPKITIKLHNHETWRSWMCKIFLIQSCFSLVVVLI